MILTLILVAALQTPTTQAEPGAQASPAVQASSSARPVETTRSNRRARPVCQNRARTGSVLKRDVCVSAQQAANQQSAARQYIEEATAGIAHEELPLGGLPRE
jgi:hypothetical protein